MSTERIILHIGRHKTGTTAIQHALAELAPTLAAEGVLYPRTGRGKGPAHHPLFHACATEHSELPRLAQDLANEARSYQTLILSSEGFQNLTDLRGLRQLLAPFDNAEIQIICYLREHLDYAISAYRQMVQNRDVFMTFAQRAKRMPDMDVFLDRWRGVGALTLRWFDRDIFEKGDVVRDFFGLCDLPPLKLTEGRDVNPSLGGNLLFFKLAANRLGHSFASYSELRDLIWNHPPFQSAFHVSDPAAADLRARSTYNDVLIRELGPVRFKSWQTAGSLPNRTQMDADLALVSAIHPNFKGEEIRSLSEDAESWFSLTSK